MRQAVGAAQCDGICVGLVLPHGGEIHRLQWGSLSALLTERIPSGGRNKVHMSGL
jgi:hypothetical protein